MMLIPTFGTLPKLEIINFIQGEKDLAYIYTLVMGVKIEMIVIEIFCIEYIEKAKKPLDEQSQAHV